MPVAPVPFPAPSPLGSGKERAIAFGGGGEWFTAFCLAYVDELLAGGVDLSRADLTVGTSAGSAMGSYLTAGIAPQAAAHWREIGEHPETLAQQVKASAPTPSQVRALKG